MSIALPAGWKVMVKNGQHVDIGTILAAPPEPAKGKKAKAKEETSPETQPLVARFAGDIKVSKKQLVISYAEKEEREYIVPSTASIWIQNSVPGKSRTAANRRLHQSP